MFLNYYKYILCSFIADGFVSLKLCSMLHYETDFSQGLFVVCQGLFTSPDGRKIGVIWFYR